MAIPTYEGTSDSSASGMGSVTPDMPSMATTGDLLVLLIEGEGEDGSADSPPTGGAWTGIGPGSVASATDGAADRTRLSAYWAPFDSGINRVVPDAGDHTLARIHVFRGVDLADPFNQTGSGSSSTNATNHSAATGFSTDEDDCLVCLAASHGDDALTPGSPANTSLSNVALPTSSQTNFGSDGTFLLITGEKATAGAGGTFTWTTAATEERAWIAFALTPVAELPNEGAATGSIDWAGSATGTTVRSGSATGSIEWAGSATGVAPSGDPNEGSASGSIAWAGSATGAVMHKGDSPGTIGWIGSSATGARDSEGAATGSVAWAGSATGVAEHRGSATGAVAWAGSATGQAVHQGGATGAVSWVGSATGARESRGSATGAILWDGFASGLAPGEDDSDPPISIPSIPSIR